MRTLSAFVLPCLLSLAVPAQEPEPASEEASPAEAAAPELEPSTREKALAAVPGLYRQRDLPGKSEQAVVLLEAALADNPDDFELHWQIARFHFWMGDTASGDDQRMAHGKKCWDYAERAKQLQSGGVQGHYWSMACIGTYSEGVGILTAVRQGLAGKFEDNGEKAVAIDASHDSGGPLRGLGRFYFKLPWPMQDLDDSRSYLERALEAGPEHPRNLAYLADLELAEKNVDAARGYLERIMALSEASNSNPPEVRRQQRWAKGKLAELD